MVDRASATSIEAVYDYNGFTMQSQTYVVIDQVRDVRRLRVRCRHRVIPIALPSVVGALDLAMSR